MPKSLADGHTKLTLVFTEPADPENPLASELNAGVDYSCDVLYSDFTWSATDSDKVSDAALCDTNNSEVPSRSNYQAGFTVFRKHDATTGAVDITEDAHFQALKVKGTRAWGYVRKNGKLASAAWAAGDEIQLGLEVLTDTPQQPGDMGGYIKNRIPLLPQKGYDFIEVA